MDRSYYPINAGLPTHKQLHAFADASDLAICYAIYLRTKTSDGQIHVSFVCGNSKVLPKHTTLKGKLSIPRAELCAAHALAEQVHQTEIDLDIANLLPTQYYSDSEDVLAQINNTTEQFKRYTASRINGILQVSQPSQWHYIPTTYNPADIGTRPISAHDLQNSNWLTGPRFLHQRSPVIPT